MADKTLDTVIIGTGPAGLAACIYASRAGLSFTAVEKFPISGGQIMNTGEIENYPGFPSVTGFELSEKLTQHAKELGTPVLNDQVLKVEKKDALFEITCAETKLISKTVIAACGAGHRKLDVPGEENFAGKGVGYCAHCDGAFYRGKTAAVVGGGDTAAGDALYLAKLCKKVYLVHRRDTLRAVHVLSENVKNTPNIEILWDSRVLEIGGGEKVSSLTVENHKTGEQKKLDADGVFIAVGIVPQNSLFRELADMDKNGFIQAGEDCASSLEGLYAAGDLRAKPLRQIITAASDGANAVVSVQDYLQKKRF